MLQVMWKVVEAIVDTGMKTTMKFHDILHGFRDCRGMGTATMEIKMAQELASIDQDPLLMVFLDLWKS